MLLSLALIAVVGGALAFKASMSPNDYCTTTAFLSQNGDKYCEFDEGSAHIVAQCVNFFAKSTAVPVEDEPEICYTITTDETPCDQLTCPREAEDIDNN